MDSVVTELFDASGHVCRHIGCWTLLRERRRGGVPVWRRNRVLSQPLQGRVLSTPVRVWPEYHARKKVLSVWVSGSWWRTGRPPGRAAALWGAE